MEQQIAEIQELIRQKSAFIERLTAEISRVIVGQKYLIDRLLIGLLADGHVGRAADKVIRFRAGVHGSQANLVGPFDRLKVGNFPRE